MIPIVSSTRYRPFAGHIPLLVNNMQYICLYIHGLAILQMNHDLRETAFHLNMIQKRAYNKEQAKAAHDNVCEFGLDNFSDCVSDVHLKGPMR